MAFGNFLGWYDRYSSRRHMDVHRAQRGIIAVVSGIELEIYWGISFQGRHRRTILYSK